MTAPGRYRTLFFGTLQQCSDMSTGGTEIINQVDMPVSMDGQGRHILKGTSLAGALLYTLRKLGYNPPIELCIDDENPVPLAEKTGQKRPVYPSVWKVSNSHLAQGIKQGKTQLRQYVKIDPASGAAEEGALFDMEVISRGNEWDFLLEVDTHKMPVQPNQLDAEQLAAIALLNWQEEGVHLGRRSVAGTGWFKLNNLKALQLDINAVDEWPNNRQTPLQTLEELSQQHNQHPGIELHNSEGLTKRLITQLNQRPVIQHPYRLEYEITLVAGPNKDESDDSTQWGLDGFFIGGHGTEMPFSLNDTSLNGHNWKDKFSTPQDYTLAPEDMPDNFFVYDEQGKPFIPGSSIRGVLHHQIRRNLTKHPEQEQLLNEIFGTTEVSSNLFVGDSHLDKDWKGLILHNHAEDEFTAGVYASSKFVRCQVIEGTFTSRIILEVNMAVDSNNPEALKQRQDKLEQHQAILEQALRQASQQQIAIGAKQWVDSGWLKWTWELKNQSKLQEDAA
ncbi:RAMP superfamily CRISPR-associated protein [Oceanospirillum beijerinckii]|uniref:RAMP superfamily CRISPR-associated protein n=1 Tax=Oceanospirillum beijerinckii TaxID=64976 RepID=UPI000421280B|nr:RAMP superfamily CRISPR-associated protein [Oceanospirillum beijerinckii]